MELKAKLLEISRLETNDGYKTSFKIFKVKEVFVLEREDTSPSGFTHTHTSFYDKEISAKNKIKTFFRAYEKEIKK